VGADSQTQRDRGERAVRGPTVARSRQPRLVAGDRAERRLIGSSGLQRVVGIALPARAQRRGMTGQDRDRDDDDR
jgi:hypothetical protein